MLTEDHFDTNPVANPEAENVDLHVGYSMAWFSKEDIEKLTRNNKNYREFCKDSTPLGLIIPNEGVDIDDIHTELATCIQDDIENGKHPIGRKRVYLFAQSFASPIVYAWADKVKLGDVDVPKAIMIAFDKNLKDKDNKKYTKEGIKPTVESILKKIDTMRTAREEELMKKSMIFE